MANPFDFLNAINLSKKDIIGESDFPIEEERGYSAFMVNRGLSYFTDTIFTAQEMNLAPDLDKYLQFTFLLNTVRKAKRFSKWAKAEKDDDITMLSEFYNCSLKQAKEIINVLTPEQFNEIKTRIKNKGGS